MSKAVLMAGTLLAPLPAVMVTCGSLDKANVLTIAWTGIINTRPPMTYISVRPTRHSYGIIKNSGEFVINLTTSKLVRETDFCGVKSGKDTDKLAKCKLHLEPASAVSAPLITESPLSLECRVVEIKPLGSHDMFIAEIVAVDADGQYIDSSLVLWHTPMVSIFLSAESLEALDIQLQERKTRALISALILRDRFIINIDNSFLKKLMQSQVLKLSELGIIDTSFIVLDSTPISANTSRNNPNAATALATIKTGTTVRKTRAAQNMLLFPMITDFQLTVSVFLSKNYTH
jgi:flavin reductase (DIM6/NTAB) family NADH-FMN oxidoreductase RutF